MHPPLEDLGPPRPAHAWAETPRGPISAVYGICAQLELGLERQLCLYHFLPQMSIFHVMEWAIAEKASLE